MASNIWPVAVENGRVHTTNQPTLNQDQDTNLSKWCISFPHGSETRYHYSFYVAPNYLSGSLTYRIRWRSSSTSGAVVWKLYAVCINNGNQLSNASLTATTATVTTTVSGTANALNESVLTISPTNSVASLTADRALHWAIARDGANASDTMTGNAEIEEILIEIAVDQTIAKGYIWVPPQAFAVPSSSSVTLGAPNNASGTSGIIQPATLAFPDSGTPIADGKITLPSNYSANLKTTLMFATGGLNGGNVGWHIDMGAASVGSSADPTLTAQSTWTVSQPGTTNSLNWDKERAAILSPSANQEVTLRITRDTTDANTDIAYFYGLMFEYDILTKRPASIRLDPGSSSLPTGVSAATISKAGDTNTNKFAATFANGADQAIDFTSFMPSLYGSGGTLRIRWRSTAGSGTARFRADFAYPANAAASDPALTTGTVSSSATNGANALNELTLDISAGLAASDTINLRLWRKGTDGADTLSASLEVLDVILESNQS